MLIASPSDCGQLPLTLCWFMGFFSLIGWKSEIYKRTQETKKKSPGVQLFCEQLLQHGLPFFWRSSWLCACLKAESYTEAEKSTCWTPVLNFHVFLFNFHPIASKEDREIPFTKVFTSSLLIPWLPPILLLYLRLSEISPNKF